MYVTRLAQGLTLSELTVVMALALNICKAWGHTNLLPSLLVATGKQERGHNDTRKVQAHGHYCSLREATRLSLPLARTHEMTSGRVKAEGPILT